VQEGRHLGLILGMAAYVAAGRVLEKSTSGDNQTLQLTLLAESTRARLREP
jgi:hypothetical protein